jgi:hypothetical protein
LETEKKENNLNKFNINKCLTIQYTSKMSQQAEAMKFQAKIYQLMNSTINAFYGNKEIFL